MGQSIIPGQKFGRLTAMSVAYVDSGGNRHWLCSCECGNQSRVLTSNLKRGSVKSCGCWKRESVKRPRNLPSSVAPGQVYGRLTVLGLTSDRKNRNRCWRCRCVCGAEVTVTTQSLRTGDSGKGRRSCGCLFREHATGPLKTQAITHGMAVYDANGRRPPEYTTWANMLQRCNNPKSSFYKDYGGRGVSVCERWHTFEIFFSDMGSRPSSKHSIDRIDVNGNYEPANCRWTTADVQASNKRPRVFVGKGGY